MTEFLCGCGQVIDSARSTSNVGWLIAAVRKEISTTVATNKILDLVLLGKADFEARHGYLGTNTIDVLIDLLSAAISEASHKVIKCEACGRLHIESSSPDSFECWVEEP
jgi:hypothetical protein